MYFFRYLARLAATDLLYLIFNIPFCMKEFVLIIDGLLITSAASAFYYSYVAIPIVNFFLTLSVYLIVWLSYDRWLAVCNPHKFPVKQNLAVVHQRFVTTIILTFIMYVPSPLRQSYECVEIPQSLRAPSCEDFSTQVGCCVFESEYMQHRWYYCYELIREIYSRFLPGILITIFNGAIIISLRFAKKSKTQHKKQFCNIQIKIDSESTSESEKTKHIPSHDSNVKCKTLGNLPNSLNCCADIEIESEGIEMPTIDLSSRSKECSDISTDECKASESGSCIVLSTDSSVCQKYPQCNLQDSQLFPEPSEHKKRRGKERLQHKDSKHILLQNTRNEREVCLVILLLAITLLFFLSSFPSALYKLIPTKGAKEQVVYNVFRAVADILELSGHVFNFCLYFLLSPEFRKTLLSILPVVSCRRGFISQNV